MSEHPQNEPLDAAAEQKARLDEIIKKAEETALLEESTALAAAEAEQTDTDTAENATENTLENAAENTTEAAPEKAEESAETPDKNTEASAQETPYTAKTFVSDLLDLLESVVTSIFVVMLIFTFLFCVANVDGESMVPTLLNGDRLIVSRLHHSYETGDILIIDSETAYTFDAEGNLSAAPGLNKRIVKRLIAQGGQEVNIDFTAGIVYVDGQALDEPYIMAATKRDNGAFKYPFVVPEGYVFVLGDNRPVSKDSRHPDVGLIAEDDIIGNVVLRIAPLSEFGKVS